MMVRLETVEIQPDPATPEGSATGQIDSVASSNCLPENLPSTSNSQSTSEQPTADQPTPDQMVSVIRFLHARGWCPATSSNFSFRPCSTLIPTKGETHVENAEKPGDFYISVSGLDKGEFGPEDFMRVDAQGRVKSNHPALKPSAETLLHALIYQRVPDAQVVLHTHTVNTTVMSKLQASTGCVTFSEYEILKGLAGITTHEATVSIPIFPNSQNMSALSQRIAYHWDHTPIEYGFILEAHGLYTWGRNVAEAKRHVEVFEYLLDCELKLMQLRG